MATPGIDVSDHALLRYLEHVKGIDIERARAEVLDIVSVAASLGADQTVRDGHIYILHACWVTTVIRRGGRMTRTRAAIRPRGPFGDRQAMRTGK